MRAAPWPARAASSSRRRSPSPQGVRAAGPYPPQPPPTRGAVLGGRAVPRASLRGWCRFLICGRDMACHARSPRPLRGCPLWRVFACRAVSAQRAVPSASTGLGFLAAEGNNPGGARQATTLRRAKRTAGCTPLRGAGTARTAETRPRAKHDRAAGGPHHGGEAAAGQGEDDAAQRVIGRVAAAIGAGQGAELHRCCAGGDQVHAATECRPGEPWSPPASPGVENTTVTGRTGCGTPRKG
jgi:hypothetical protein